ncbi:MAG: geranylgeranylglyceryl/heptaprenylglyceryl phosphate synthase [Bacteroidetes bacterium]|jgi:putative glycerol-1-phosphate prenyltransferase|nr:geranylgeranylglyceryl/heptaprenylglyceryl phosphate synthase [Bacteroidota bacterium]
MHKIQSWLVSRHKAGIKTLAVLFDPDDDADLRGAVAQHALRCGIDLFLVGGSLLTEGNTYRCVDELKQKGAGQVVLFPGNEIQVVSNADAILFMSLISGRNPEYLIAKQVAAAPFIRRSELETIPTGYLLIEGGKMTAAHYVSQTMPIPADKPEIAATTVLAGAMLGMKAMYLDAGSGASRRVSPDMIAAVRHIFDGVLIIGGGIRDAEAAETAWNAGADVVVVGNAAFENPDSVREIAEVLNKMNSSKVSMS